MGLIIHVDGGSRGNPGLAGAGVVIETDGGTLVHEAAYFLGKQTNNAAEYHAVIRALERVQRCQAQPLRVCSDSQLLVRQITGEYEVRSPKLAPLYRQVQMLLLRTTHWSFRHIPRAKNRRADELANLAIDRRRSVVLFDIDEHADADTDAAEEAPPTAAEEASGPTAVTKQDSALPVTGRDAPPALEARSVQAVRVALARAPVAAPGVWPAESAEKVCSAGAGLPQEFTVESALPAGLCVYAAHAILPTLLAMLSTEPQEFTALPTLIVRCNRSGCPAVFHLSPVRAPNGNRRRDDT